MENNPDLAVGIGQYLPVPAFGIVSDLGGAVPNLRAGFGLYTIAECCRRTDAPIAAVHRARLHAADDRHRGDDQGNRSRHGLSESGPHVPVPLSAAVVEPPHASEILSVALRLPVTVGLNRTDSVHVGVAELRNGFSVFW